MSQTRPSARRPCRQLRRSKTDRESEGRKVGLPFGSNPLTCPVRALRAWLDVAAIGRGPIFRPVDRHATVADTRLTNKSVALVVKRCAKAAGLDFEKYAGHSLRSGLATAAAIADVSERAIMAQTGHKSLPMVRRYEDVAHQLVQELRVRAQVDGLLFVLAPLFDGQDDVALSQHVSHRGHLLARGTGRDVRRAGCFWAAFGAEEGRQVSGPGGRGGLAGHGASYQTVALGSDSGGQSAFSVGTGGALRISGETPVQATSGRRPYQRVLW